ncbi:MAG: FIST C-terminal domain-containing protein [Planctomycetes bacterium]|nr:FIST C-terminal domain-containing protein [Planctomycetota bacterium]
MRFHHASTAQADLETACREVAATLRLELGPGPVDLVVVFAAPGHGRNLDRLPVLLHEMLAPRVLLGCTGSALIAGTQLLGGRHGLVVMAGRLPGVGLHAVALANADLPSPDAPPSAWHALVALPPGTPVRGMIVLTEPFQCDAKALLTGLDYGWPDVPKIGGIASGSRHPEGQALFLQRQASHSGAIVLMLTGNLEIGSVVAQGCRPFGRPGRITRADRNRLVRIDDASARDFVAEQLGTLDHDELGIAEQSPLFLGIAPDPFAAAAPRAGEFLVRNILGIDPESGNLLVGDELAIGRHVQLHLRDPRSSQRELRQMLRRAEPATAQAALLFRCLGREGPDHTTFAAEAGGVPLVGFHCNGEIGPVGGTSHLLGYTAAFALLRRRAPTLGA